MFGVIVNCVQKRVRESVCKSVSDSLPKYFPISDGTTVYELSAVLIHRGPSAYSGHYVAHIQDLNSKLWYRFNDEDIVCMKGRKLQLGKEEEITTGGKHNSPYDVIFNFPFLMRASRWTCVSVIR